jgi:phage baseplate assembly protein W
MAEQGKDFLGVGWKWPVQPENGSIALSHFEERIQEAILTILGTAKGERVMRPDFGCGVHDLVFAPNNEATAARVSFEVREALIDFEPRIEVLDVQGTPDPQEPARLLVHIQYRVRATNNSFNLVYPFYLERSGA